MRGLSVIVALCTGVAVATAFSVTPSFISSSAGTGDETVTALVHDNFGSVFVSGWTNSALLNTSFINGGPTGKTHYAPTYMRLGEAENGFVTKFNVYGIPVWSVAIGGTGADRANAIALNADQTIALVCGTYDSSDAKVYPTVGTAVSLSAAVAKDVFVVGLNATTGAYVWSFATRSSGDDECFAIAESNGRVAYGGYGMRNVATGFIVPEGTSSNIVGTSVSNRAAAFVGLADSADGSSASTSRRWMSSPAPTFNGGQNGYYAGITRALTFDAFGNLWVALNVEVYAGFSAGYANSVDGTHDVGVVMYNAASLNSQFNFQDGANLDPCLGNGGYNQSPTLDDASLDPSCVTYPSTGAHGIDLVAYFGSNGDDVVTGIVVQNAGNTTEARVVLTGYTVGAEAGSKFRLQKYTETLNAVSFAAWAPATALDMTLPTNGEVGWWVASKASFNGETGSGFFGKVLPPGITGRVTGVKCDPSLFHCFASATLQGSGVMSVLYAAKNFSSTAGSRDAVIMRFDQNGNILWLEQSGAAQNDTGDAVGYYPLGPGVVRPGPYSILGGSFRTMSYNTMTSASPIVVSGRGGRDAFVTVYDDIDDCGRDATYPANPYGPNACGVKVGNLTQLGASMCLDEPGFPLCFCHMNVTDGTPGTFCNRRGWNCKFMAQYYFGLLDMCDCPPAANPHVDNPLLDIEGRLQLCSGNVCTFGQLTGEHSQCLPLVLDLMNFCGASPDTSATDLTYITLFKGFYAGCNSGKSSSSTGEDCTGFDFCAAPRASTPASGLVTALATVAAAVLIAAANSRRE